MKRNSESQSPSTHRGQSRVQRPPEPIVGYREWNIRPDGKLESITMDTVWEPGKVMKGKVGEPVNLGFISMATMTGFFGFCFCLMLGEFIWALVALTNHEPDRIAGLIILASFSLPFLMFCVLGIREMRHTPFRQYADRYGPPPGVYAYKKPAFIEVYYIPFRVQGEVWLWGDVVEHQDGYRAQYAYPKEIYGRPDLTEKYREAQR